LVILQQANASIANTDAMKKPKSSNHASADRFTVAMARHRAGAIDEAMAMYRRILEATPQHANALHFLGVAMQQRGDLPAALDMMRRSIAADPGVPAYFGNLANLLRDCGQLADATDNYRALLALDPESAGTWLELGRTLFALHRPDAATAAMEEAGRRAPRNVDLLFAIAAGLHDNQQLEAALPLLERVLALAPTHADASNRLGGVLADLGQEDAAISCYQHALASRPNFLAARNNLGIALHGAGRYAEAVATYGELLRMDPNFARGYCNLGNVLRDTGQTEAAVTAFRRAIAISPRYAKAYHNLLFTLNFVDGMSRAALFTEHTQFGAAFADPTAVFADTDNVADRRLRIGYVSGDLRRHPVGFLIEALLEHRDRNAFEVFCYSNTLIEDELSAKLRQHADAWVPCLALDDAALAARIRADRIDILVDLAGHTEHNRLTVFAQRPAPVQATYLGYANTTGLAAIDWRLTDRFADPEGAEAFNSERLIRLNHSYYCYLPRPDAPPVAPPPALANGFVSFGCCLNYAKLSKSALTLWAATLSAITDARLVLRASGFSDATLVQDALARFSAAGIDPARITLLPHATFPDHLKTYDLIDIGLDTTPFNLATNSVEALWQGVPLVTLAGDTSAGRMGMGLLDAAGMSELVATDTTHFVRLCANLAADCRRLAHMRQTQRSRLMASPLLDGRAKAGELERAYRTMWTAHCEGS
jgi:protein O-GlcNAc transferase